MRTASHTPHIVFEPESYLSDAFSCAHSSGCSLNAAHENSPEHLAPLLIVGVGSGGDGSEEPSSAVTTNAETKAGSASATQASPSHDIAPQICAVGLDSDKTKQLNAALRTLKASSDSACLTSLPAPWHSGLFISAAGLGAGTTSDMREAAGAAVRSSVKHLEAGQDIVVSIEHSTLDELEAIAQGALLGAYSFDTYKKKKHLLPRCIHIVTPCAAAASEGETSSTSTSSCEGRDMCESGDLAALAQRTQIIAEATWGVRDLVNTPTSDLNTEELADIALRTAEEAGCSVRVWNAEQLHADKLEGLLAVGAGSAHEPRLVRIEWAPSNPQSYIALVGKGITYDTGGYSLKPRTSMATMKTDMTGAATALHTIIAAARLGLPHKVVAWLCIAENMVSSTAQRVDDVIMYRNGITVEVTNTDAEGRLVMADGLIMACEESPDAVIDIATLTGAQIIALGNRFTGVMGSDDIREKLVEAASSVGELAWGMPLPQYLQRNLASPIADMANSASSREAGMLVAGVFLKNFVNPDIPWAHLDIAGPAFLDKEWGCNPRGGTGVMVRTLVEFIERS